MKPVTFHREADAEFIYALHHYTSISSELGGRYYDVVQDLIADICTAPSTFRFIRKPARRHFTREFPYGLIYVERPDDILILAVMHLHREPNYWSNRIK